MPQANNSQSFYDQVLALPPEDRDAVIESMSDADLVGFNEHVKAKAPASPAATPPAPAASEKPGDPVSSVTEGPTMRQSPEAYGAPRAATPEALRTKPLPEPPAPTPTVRGDPAVEEVQGVPTSDRLLVQNLAANPGVAAAYIRKTHPELEAAVYNQDAAPPTYLPKGSGQYEVVPEMAPPSGARVVTRRKDAKPGDPWRVIDPQTGIDDVPEFLKDVGDVAASDVPNGILNGLATTGGGLGGAMLGAAAGPAGAGAGAMVGASAAGAATNSALEAARNYLGQLFGIPQKLDDSDLTSAAVEGGVSPLLFGTGASPKQALAHGVEYQTQRGIPSKLLNEGTARATSFFSGMPLKDIKQARARLPEIQAVEKKGMGGVREIVENSQNDIREGLYQNQKRLGKEIFGKLQAADVPVDITTVKAQLKELIAELEAQKGSATFTGAREHELTTLNSIYNDIFKADKKVVETLPPEKNAISLLGIGQVTPPATVEKTVKVDIPDFIDAVKAQKLKGDLTDLSKIRQGGGRYNVPSATAFDKHVQSRASQSLKELGDAIQDATERYDAKLGVPKGKRGVKPLNERYKALKWTEDALAPFLDDSAAAEKKSFSILRNLGAKTNVLTRDTLTNLDKEYGTNVVKNADLLNSMAIFSDPATVPISGWGSTSTSRSNLARGLFGGIGSAAGYKTAEAMGMNPHMGAAMGLSLGGGLGQKLVTPSAIRGYMNAGQRVRNASGFLQRPFGLDLKTNQMIGSQFAVPGIWDMIQQNQQQQ